jgi:POT family proton-dependent oligopeptide transporter
MTATHSHPKALPYLCLTEMWERFGFYVVQGMLVLYMTKALHFSDDSGYTTMGAFWALAYLSPFVGGSLADRLLGFKTSTLLGGIFLSSGYAMLALPWPGGFYFSLATIIIGNGLLKPSISSLLGSLYERGNPNRESGFTLFYIGINFGALLAGVSSGYIKDTFGWNAGFALASIGLVIGLLTFVFGLKNMAELQPYTHHTRPKISLFAKIAIALGCVVTIYLIAMVLQNSTLSKWLLPIGGIVNVEYVDYFIRSVLDDLHANVFFL